MTLAKLTQRCVYPLLTFFLSVSNRLELFYVLLIYFIIFKFLCFYIKKDPLNSLLIYNCLLFGFRFRGFLTSFLLLGFLSCIFLIRFLLLGFCWFTSFLIKIRFPPPVLSPLIRTVILANNLVKPTWVWVLGIHHVSFTLNDLLVSKRTFNFNLIFQSDQDNYTFVFRNIWQNSWLF